MKIRLTFQRTLALIAIVLLLSFVYFLVRADHTGGQSPLQNPARLAPVLPVSAPVNEEVPAQGPYLVVEDAADPLSLSLRPAVELALGRLGYAPLYTVAPTAAQLKNATGGVLVTAAMLSHVGGADALLDYARAGGFLVFAVRPEVDDVFRNIYQQLGIYEHSYYAWSQGFHLEEGLITKEPYDRSGVWLENSILELHVGADCRVYATNDSGMPLIWALPYGEGQILVMNNSLMAYKATGGLLLALLGQLQGPLLYPVVNARVFALESFPLPADVNSAFLREVYLRSGRSFLRDLWWNDMVRFSRISGIPITAALLTGYDSEAAYPSFSIMNTRMDLAFYLKELAKYGGEAAFTGFNQKPLYFSPPTEGMSFMLWSSYELAQQRTGEALSLFDAYFPQYELYAYLPPERVLDEQGYALIKEQMHALQVVCGDFYSETRWLQDFGVEADGVVSFPVVTAGFEDTALSEWNLLCAANALGVVFHACDVSDLLLETEPDKSWSQLSASFFAFADKALPETAHLDGLTITAAARRLRAMEAQNPTIALTDVRAIVSIPPGQRGETASFLLYSPGRIPAVQPGISITELGSGRYFIESTIDRFELELVAQ